MRKNYAWLFAVALFVIAADQVTKYLVLDGLTSALEGGRGLAGFLGPAPAPGLDGYHYHAAHEYTVSPDYFRLRYAENPGAAFGLFRTVPAGFRGPLFHLVSLGAVVLIGFYVSRLTGAANERWARWGLPLVLGGALGNYVDRLARGFVIDFFEAHWLEKAYWPAFNVADSAIVLGVGLLIVDSLVRKEAGAGAKAVAGSAAPGV